MNVVWPLFLMELSALQWCFKYVRASNFSIINDCKVPFWIKADVHNYLVSAAYAGTDSKSIRIFCTGTCFRDVFLQGHAITLALLLHPITVLLS